MVWMTVGLLISVSASVVIAMCSMNRAIARGFTAGAFAILKILSARF